MNPVLLITRPEPEASSLAREFSAPNLRVIVSPLQRIAFRSVPAGEGALIFTSRNGVRAWRKAGGGPRRAWCVGEATAAEARVNGHWTNCADGDAEALLTLLQQDASRAEPLIHVRGLHHRGGLVDRLRQAGFVAQAADMYEQQPQPFTPEAHNVMIGPAPVIAPLYSPRTARLFREGWHGGAPLYLGAISPSLLTELTDLSARQIVVADVPDANAMRQVTGELVAAARQLAALGPGS